MAFLQKLSLRSSSPNPPAASLDDTDKLSLTLCLAIVAHFFIILGISFSPEISSPKHRYNSIDVTLVQHESPEPPKEATALAQKNLDAGNTGEENLNPLEKDDAPIPDENPEPTAAPHMLENPPEDVSENTEQESVAETPPAVEPEEFMTREVEDSTATANAQTPETPATTPDKTVDELPPQAVETPPLPSASELITSSFKIAALSAQIEQRLANKAKRPRRKFISAATREYRFASYMETWRAKVERFGNLNYPKEVRERKLSGSLILDVALLPDGNIDSVTVKRSSGNPLLDKAAIRIVRMAAPYASFPENLSNDTDILHITRTWRFSDGRQFQ